MPAFKGGHEVSLSDYKGKLLLIEFWISHCGHCIRAVEALNAIRRDYPGEDLEIVSINIHDDAHVISRFIENNRPEYTMLVGGESVSQSYGIAAYPSAVLVGRDGRALTTGIFDAAVLRRRIDDALR